MDQEGAGANRRDPEHSKGTRGKRQCNETDFRVKYKTELCRNYGEGTCLFGRRCAFAHGGHELKGKMYLPRNYKTKLCQKFSSFGFCSYGTRCQFIHQQWENSRSTSPSPEGRRLPIFQEIENKCR